MATEEDLLAAIDSNPDEDAPRLAHADWLEANGEVERARYIRLQVAGKAISSATLMDGLPVVRGMSWLPRRGYAEVVWFASLKAFKEGWPLTAGRHVRHVQFHRLRGTKLAEEPALGSISSLGFSAIEPAVIFAVLRSLRLGPLRHLAVAPRPYDPGFLADLATLPALAGLRSLEVAMYSDPVPEGALAALVGSPHLTSLRSLKVRGSLDEATLRALFRPSSLAGLVSLELGKVGIRSSATRQAGLDELGDGSVMPGLERFVIGYSNHEGGDVAGAVARAICWNRLRVLDLSETGIGDAGAITLAEAAHLSRLERLSIARSCVADAGAQALADSPHLRSLSYLDLTRNFIGRSGVAAFGRTMSLPRLRELLLAGNPAPKALIASVEARFRDGGPPVEEAPPTLPAVAAPPVPLVGGADEDALVRAIWADPFDEVARLVYADWLEEQGNPLYAAVLRAPRGPARVEAQIQLELLMSQDAPCMFESELQDGLLRVAISPRHLRSKAFQRDGPAWLKRHHVAEVILDGQTSNWPALFAGEWLTQTRGLSFGGRPFEDWEALAGSSRLAALGSLELRWSNMEMADELFGGSGLRGLCRLLVGDHLRRDGLRALCQAPFAPLLRHLHFGSLFGEFQFDALDGMPVLTNAPELVGLVTLGLGIGNSAMKILADATAFTSLRNLDLTGGYFTELGLDALEGSALLSGLRRLHIRASADLTTPALERLSRALPPTCRLVLQGPVDSPQREPLAAILGDRLVLG